MMQLQWNQPLIVVHANNGIVVALHRLMKETIRRIGSVGFYAGFFGRPDRRLDNFFFFIAKDTFLAAVGVQGGYGDARPRNAEKITQAPVGQFQSYSNTVSREMARNFAVRQMPGDWHHSQLSADQHHTPLPGAA